MRGLCLSTLLALLLAIHTLGALPKGKRWQDLTDKDWERLEKELESGDDAAELESHERALYEEIEKKENAGELGATMMFVQLKAETNEQDTRDFGERLKILAKTGGVDVSVFKLEPSKLVVTLQKGWFAEGIYNLAQSQPEVEHVLWQDGVHRGIADGSDSDVASLSSDPRQQSQPVKSRRRRRKRKAAMSPTNEKTEL